VSAASKKRKQRQVPAEDRVHVLTPETSSVETSDNESSGGLDTTADAKSPKVWLPGMPLAEGEVLEPDMSVYVMLQEMQVEWPCLSFDVLRSLADPGRESLDFPLEASLVAGTQADRADRNKILLMRWSNLRKNQSRDYDNEASDAESDTDDEDDSGKGKGKGDASGAKWTPQLHLRSVSHAEGAGINRTRALQSPESLIVSTWSERGTVYLWDLTALNRELHAETTEGASGLRGHETVKMRPLGTVTGHRQEGFALDWSRREWGNLVSGDCNGLIHWAQLDAAGTAVTMNGQPFTGHGGSVEDLQWSPSESTVFASASCDQTVRVWDIRCDPRRPALSLHCHDSDVNVIAWNRSVDYLLASGGDDGSFKTWDLRSFPAQAQAQAASYEATLATPVAAFQWHRGPITSLEWHPSEASVLAVAGADDQISLWDFAVERDAEQEKVLENDLASEESNVPVVPPHLLFTHHGQREVKELHWHPQAPGAVLSTAASGFNIFKTISI
jgi:ribosome assembly protein RRB1